MVLPQKRDKMLLIVVYILNLPRKRCWGLSPKSVGVRRPSRCALRRFLLAKSAADMPQISVFPHYSVQAAEAHPSPAFTRLFVDFYLERTKKGMGSVPGWSSPAPRRDRGVAHPMDASACTQGMQSRAPNGRDRVH